jgi:hypothetical protein
VNGRRRPSLLQGFIQLQAFVQREIILSHAADKPAEPDVHSSFPSTTAASRYGARFAATQPVPFDMLSFYWHGHGA